MKVQIYDIFSFFLHKMSYICISIYICMNTVLLSIGSNTFAKTNIDKARRMLSRTFPDIVFSTEAMSPACGEKAILPFRNILAKFDSELTPAEIIPKLKMIEVAVGRSPKDKYLKRVIMDIDLIVYGDEVLRPDDYEREYVRYLLNTFLVSNTNPYEI